MSASASGDIVALLRNYCCQRCGRGADVLPRQHASSETLTWLGMSCGLRLSGSTYRVCAPPDGNPHKLIDTYGPRMGECVESLTDEQIWWRPNEASNSVGNLLLYPNGDVRQRLVAPFRGVKDERDRLA